MYPLGVPRYPWKIVGIDYVTNLPKRGSNLYTSVFIMVFHLTKMAHFVPCHKDIIDSPLKNQVNYLLIIVIDCMVSQKLLCHIEILNLLGNSDKAL